MQREKGHGTAGASPATNEAGNSGGTRRRVLGRRRRTAGLTVETFWMWTLGLTAECGANVMLVMLCGMAPLEAMVHAVFPPSIDAQLTMLNLSGAFFDGAAVFLAKWHFEFSEPPLLLVFRSGFCSVWTSLAGVVEHGASLQPLTGIGYLGIMICLGVGANELGRLCMEFIAVPVLVQAKLMKSSTSYVKINLSETLWDDVLFNLLAVFVALCAGLCHWDYLPYDLSELLTGFLVVPCSFAVGSWIEGGHEWDNVQWGTWRCNTAAFLVLLSTVVVAGLMPSAPDWALHRRIAGTFCGALSSFNGLSGDTTELLRRGRRRGALANGALNFATGVVFLVLLRAVPWWMQRLQHLHSPSAVGPPSVAGVWGVYVEQCAAGAWEAVGDIGRLTASLRRSFHAEL